MTAVLERLDRRRFPTVMSERPLDIRVAARDARCLQTPWLERRILSNVAPTAAPPPAPFLFTPTEPWTARSGRSRRRLALRCGWNGGSRGAAGGAGRTAAHRPHPAAACPRDRRSLAWRGRG